MDFPVLEMSFPLFFIAGTGLVAVHFGEHSTFVSMKLFGLIGYPLVHSFSQAYFTRKFEELRLHDHRYQNFPIERLEDFPKLLSTETDLHGLNVTIPYKELIIPYLDVLSHDVEVIGAVNTICFESAGLVGYNTDWIGFKQSLTPSLGLWSKLPSALILGTGGSAKAVGYALIQLNIPYLMVSRKRRATGLTYEELTDDIIADSLLIINTTPVGMSPKTETAPVLNYQAITPRHLLFDLIYNPAQTLFLRKGQEHGAQVKNGLEMLQYQAEASWALWQSNLEGFSY